MIISITVVIVTIILLLLIILIKFSLMSGIWFQSEGPKKDKAFWPVFVFRKDYLSSKKLFLKLILPSAANSKTSFK